MSAPSPSRQLPSMLRVAVAQAEPAWLDLEASVNKTCALIDRAGSQGAKVLAFPECWIPGYPGWIWSRPVDIERTKDYIKNSLRVESTEMDRIKAAAARHGIVVVLGFSGRQGDSLYIAQATIDGGQQGRLLAHRRKLKATHMERTIFGDASGEALVGVVDTTAGRVGALACWEHAQPLLKYHMYSHRQQLHVAAWPPLHPHEGPELWSMSSEGQSLNMSRAPGSRNQTDPRPHFVQALVLCRAPMQSRDSLLCYTRPRLYHNRALIDSTRRQASLCKYQAAARRLFSGLMDVKYQKTSAKKKKE